MQGSTLSRALLLPLLGFGLAAVPALAADDAWSVRGEPSGGTVHRVIVDPASPSKLWSAGNAGIFVSTDAGATWHASLPLGMGDAQDVAADPQAAGTLYAATLLEGVMKTTDGGQTWSAVDTGLPTVNAGAMLDGMLKLAVDPVTEGTLYVVSSQNGVYKSSDGGGSWTPKNNGLSALQSSQFSLIQALSIDPANPNVLFLGSLVPDPVTHYFADDADSGIYRSTDGGASWTEVQTHMAFLNFAVDPSNDQTVYAGGIYLYVSADNGATWTKATGNAATAVGVLAVDPANSTHLWGQGPAGVGLYESTDQGADWNLVDTGLQQAVVSMAQDTATPANLYLSALHYGIAKRGAGGTTWAEADSGLYGVVTQAILRGADGTLFLGTQESGVLKGDDDGASWSQASTGLTVYPYAGVDVYAFAADPDDTASFYAATADGLFKTTDGAVSWSPMNLSLSPPYIGVDAVTVDPEDGQKVWAGAPQHGVYLSADGGASWAAATTGITDSQIQALAVSPADGKTVFAGGITDGLFVTRDQGASWSPVDTGAASGDVFTIAFDPEEAQTVFVSEGGGLFKSTDGGVTWTESDSGLAVIAGAIIVDPTDSNVVFAVGVQGSGIYVSSDGGATWAGLITDGLSAKALLKAPMTRRFAPGAETPPLSRAAGVPVGITALSLDPVSRELIGSGSDGQLYVFNYETFDVGGPGNGSGGSSGGPGGGSGGTVNSNSAGPPSAGGGAFSWLLGLLLLGVGSWRRRRPN